ncbi:MAG: transposase [Nitrospirae bacterium RBG_16_64_22]|nr:MAG: transposase [Nitrospirae bacterium RBG_16_64_22]
MRKRQTFSPAFKTEAVRLLERGDKPAAEIARELDVRRNRLYKWQREVRAHGEHAFPGPGRQPKPAEEIARLKQELARVTEERDILKKAATYFARESQ